MVVLEQKFSPCYKIVYEVGRSLNFAQWYLIKSLCKMLNNAKNMLNIRKGSAKTLHFARDLINSHSKIYIPDLEVSITPGCLLIINKINFRN
ncbi:hypothetical protein BpHYR1_047235 [Brachionus plicatilis]|uniref:Uncharacterized protein n=1 Tax=Brachionus plicatilis TaxID=10195 RepID=A0A3M7QS40_BRAPC|nr:hypothetical protein BpHYR1_047235 [Brachionus plicatilis]